MSNPPSGHDSLVLLVEDEQDTADLVPLVMKERGDHVSHTPDGSAAREKIALMPPLPPSR